VQVGPVALTFAWLRGTADDIGSGELLVIVWHGIAAPRRNHQFERVLRTPIPQTAAELWEQVFQPGTVGPDRWQWRTRDEEPTGEFTAPTLAAHCVGQLRDAYHRITASDVSADASSLNEVE
jgi:hypothetical protein